VCGDDDGDGDDKEDGEEDGPGFALTTAAICVGASVPVNIILSTEGELDVSAAAAVLSVIIDCTPSEEAALGPVLVIMSAAADDETGVISCEGVSSPGSPVVAIVVW